MGVTWATASPTLGTAIHPFEDEGEVDPDLLGFRVDGPITRRITKLFPPDDPIWNYEGTGLEDDEVGPSLNEHRFTRGRPGWTPPSN